jgi:hypothetical protein
MARTDELLASPLGLQLLELISQRELSQMSDDDLDRMVTELDLHVSRFRGDYEPYVAVLRTRAAQLESLAEWLPQRMPRWWDAVDRMHQVWVGRAGEAPIEGRLMVDLSPFHAEAPKPRQAFWTCTRLSTLVSPWLESSEKLTRGPERFWVVTASEAARVAEIHSPNQWSDLARAYPRTEPGSTFTTTWPRPESSTRLDPDWSKVAQDWDGVHLSVGGLLTAEDVPRQSGGLTTELRGWNMESTVWLRWSFDSVGPLDVIPSDG